MPTTWTLNKLEAMSVHDRHNLFKNAVRLSHTAEGAALAAMMKDAGLPFSEDGGMSMSDPIYLKMEELTYSPAGRSGAVAATKEGLPALAGVEPILTEALGVDYGPHNMDTVNAGYLVGEVMRMMGYRIIGRKPMPAGSVAKTAAMWG